MKINALCKDLFRYSCLLSLIVAATAMIFLYVFKQASHQPVLYSLLVGIRFFLMGVVNIWILRLLDKISASMPERKKKFLRYGLSYAIALVFFFITDPLAQYLTHPLLHDKLWPDQILAVTVQGVMNNSLVLILHNFVILQHHKANHELEIARLSAANVESTNLLLKQQIHPHFLFNALSMLKSLYKSDINAGEEYLTHLVSFLRASLADSHARVARLSDEVNLCNDYLEMQKIRFENALVCTIDIPEEVLLHGSVPLFSIQSLIENAIKHNEVSELSPLVIKVYYKDDRIITENNIQLRTLTDTPSRKGLMNLVERYRILSDDEVIIRQENGTFSVSIKVLNNEDSNHRG
ncbi:MAG TPA: histidine kinase [Chitinophaga sp.]|nr:histidine kinase [Chitinophaga sp.]